MATPPVFSAGSVLTAAQMNAVGLWLVKTDTITSGTSKEITGAFNSDYNNYRIVISNLKGSAADSLWLRMGTVATGVYYWGGVYIPWGGAATAESGAGDTKINTGGVIFTNNGGGIIELQNPYATTTTTFQTIMTDPRTAGGSGGRNYSGVVNTTTSYTSFTISSSGGATFTSCDIAVYGYRK